MNFQQRYSAYETTNFKGMKYNVYKSTNVYPYKKGKNQSWRYGKTRLQNHL